MIWKVNVPPKARTFIRRAFSNIHPTLDNLHQRKIQVDRGFELCQQQPETCDHLLRECPFARNAWALVKGKVHKCSNEAQDFFHLFGAMAGKLTKEQLEQWTVLFWAIWNARNKFYFEKTKAQPKGILQGALAVLETYQRVSTTQESSQALGCCFRFCLECLICFLCSFFY